MLQACPAMPIRSLSRRQGRGGSARRRLPSRDSLRTSLQLRSQVRRPLTPSQAAQLKPLRQRRKEVLSLSLRSMQWQSKVRARGLTSLCQVTFLSILSPQREALPSVLAWSGACHGQTRDCLALYLWGSPSSPMIISVVGFWVVLLLLRYCA